MPRIGNTAWRAGDFPRFRTFAENFFVELRVGLLLRWLVATKPVNCDLNHMKLEAAGTVVTRYGQR